MYKTKSSRTSSADEIRETTAVPINVNLNFFPSLAVGGVSAYDKAVSEASEIYKGRGQLVVQKPIPEII